MFRTKLNHPFFSFLFFLSSTDRALRSGWSGQVRVMPSFKWEDLEFILKNIHFDLSWHARSNIFQNHCLQACRSSLFLSPLNTGCPFPLIGHWQVLSYSDWSFSRWFSKNSDLKFLWSSRLAGWIYSNSVSAYWLYRNNLPSMAQLFCEWCSMLYVVHI